MWICGYMDYTDIQKQKERKMFKILFTRTCRDTTGVSGKLCSHGEDNYVLTYVGQKEGDIWINVFTRTYMYIDYVNIRGEL